MTILKTLFGAGLLLSLGAANAQPTQPPTLLLAVTGGHPLLSGSSHIAVVRHSHHKTRHAKRSRRVTRPHTTAMRSPSMSGGRMTSPSPSGTSNVTTSAPTTGTANTGRNSAPTPASRRRRVPPPGPLTNNGQAAPGTDTTGTTGATGGTTGTP